MDLANDLLRLDGLHFASDIVIFVSDKNRMQHSLDSLVPNTSALHTSKNAL